MKINLLGTTVLAAGCVAVSGMAFADKPKLTLGGSTEQAFGVGADDKAFERSANASAGQRVGFDQHSDGEIFFNGSVTLDNGIKIRTRVGLESNTESNTAGETPNVAHGTQGDTIDEHWMRLSGAFGEVRLGSGDAAAQAMTTGYLGTWATNVGLNQAFDTSDWVTRPTSIALTTVNRIDVSSDGEHISYFTPRFSGFQFGLSYVPSSDEDINNQRGLKGSGDNEGWSFGANFDSDIAGVGVAVAVGYAFANEATSGAAADAKVWGIAGRVDYQGFRVAASWADKNDQNTATGPFVSAGRESFEIGGRYTFGANAVSISHMRVQSDTELVTANDDKIVSTFVAYRRTLGPGVSWQLVAIFAEYEDGAPAVAGSSSNDGKAVVTSLKLVF